MVYVTGDVHGGNTMNSIVALLDACYRAAGPSAWKVIFAIECEYEKSHRVLLLWLFLYLDLISAIR